MSTPSGTVVQYGLSGGQALFTDTGSYSTLLSRNLTIYDYLGEEIETFDMGTNLTQIFSFAADAWFQFTCVVVDNTGTWTTNVYFVSQGYYYDAYLTQFNATNCGCNGNNGNLELSQLSLQAALRFNLAGSAGAASAQTSIVAANFFVNQNIISQWP